jgi:hypothetical protein
LPKSEEAKVHLSKYDVWFSGKGARNISTPLTRTNYCSLKDLGRFAIIMICEYMWYDKFPPEQDCDSSPVVLSICQASPVETSSQKIVLLA